jgi:hypothetical protein
MKKQKPDAAAAMFPRYVLDAQGEPVLEPDLHAWAQWWEKVGNRRLAWDDLGARGTVSTVFLGTDHNFGGRKGEPPILWESMIFGGPLDGTMRRYATREDALAGHFALIDELIRTEDDRVNRRAENSDGNENSI